MVPPPFEAALLLLFLLINRKLKEKHLEILKWTGIKWSFTKFLFV